jgi:hypothetical protein
MTITPAQENERMLARMLGIDEDQAAARLEQSITITASGNEGLRFGKELKEQLERTIHVLSEGQPANLEIAIGAPARGTGKKTLFVAIRDDTVTVSRSPLGAATATLHGIQRIIGACYVASRVLGELIEDLAQASRANPFTVRFSAIGASRDVLERPIHLEDTALVGAGAVGNGFLRAARHLDLRGVLDVCDPKVVGSGNPNRCLFFTADDVGKDKATQLCGNAAAGLTKLQLIPHVEEFAAFRKRRAKARVKRVIIGTDSRQARRSIAGELPLEVIDASTTGATEIIVFSHGYPNCHACLGCIYPAIADELGRARDISSGLGVPLAVVVSGQRIDKAIAQLIVCKHPGLNAEALEGKAFDSLFKQLCAEEALLSPTGEQVLAPFAFISSLAGALQALELARFESQARFIEGKNYLFVSPWSPAHSHSRLLRPRLPNCEICGRLEYATVTKTVWADQIRP